MAANRRWWALVVIALAQLMVILDMTIVNIALPSAQTALHMSDGNRQWVITAYTLAFGGLLLLGGRIADLAGRRVAFMTGLLGFAAASALGGAAADSGMLFGARVRRQKVRPRATPLENEALELPGHHSTHDQALETLGTERALELVARLPRDQAEAVLLRVVVGLDGPAAARVLGKRPGAVRTAAHRGLRRLAQQIAADGTDNVTDDGAASGTDDGATGGVTPEGRRTLGDSG
ncbi:MFS transporter [Streptomyces sp. NBC_01571]|uniref:MFS transporter n=1 Tax=Streptomyces sp. NBC_01571 TaxID=2975883 RepID=UPI0022551F8C|nr:MFS transporter [Streptomyces sp. NBC_01571]MCX4577058.1 MFS transporter [Streptomyces sp. NBC_01571]